MQGTLDSNDQLYEAAREKMMKLLFESAEAGVGGEQRFGVAHCDSASLADALARQIRDRYPESDVLIVECGPALGALYAAVRASPLTLVGQPWAT